MKSRRSLYRSAQRATTQLIESLERRQLLHAPVLDTIANQSVPVNSYLQLPITATDAEGNDLTYQVSVSNNGASAGFHSGNSYIQMNVSGKTGSSDTAFSGSMTFQLFDDIAPHTARKIKGLVESGFYDGLAFHRVYKGFVAQGGDPNGDGTGGPGFQSEDEINQYTQYTGDGQLAMARSSHDTDGSQFFITDGNQQSALDYQYTLFGQMVRGGSTLDKLLDTKVTANTSGENSDPVNDPKIVSASFVENNSDGVLQIKAGANTGTTTITVTVTNEHGESDSQSFTLTRAADTQNGATYLTPLNSYRATAKDAPLTFTIGATDPDGDNITYAAAIVNEDGSTVSTPNGQYSITGNKITVTPNSGYTGPLHVIIGARDDSHNFDTQIITITVGGKAIGATAQNVNVAAGAPTPGMVIGTFTGGTSANTAADFSIAFTTDARANKIGGVNWGDGTVTNGTIVKNTDGSYSILGNHQFPAAGTYEITMTVRGPKGAKQVFYSQVTARNIAELKAGTLRIYGSSGNDSIGTSLKSGKLNANVNGAVKKFTPSAVSRVEYYLFEGADAGSVGTGIPNTYMDGGTGDDNLVGGDGRDTLTAGAGKNTLFGGAGDDRLNGSGGRDFLYGQDGDDRLYGNGGDDYLDGGGNVDRLFGGDGADNLFGGSSNDKLYGEGGNDTLYGQKGNDLLDGGAGTDASGDSVGTDIKTSIP